MFFFTNDMCKYILIDCETVMSLGSVLDISCQPGTLWTGGNSRQHNKITAVRI